MFDTRLSYARFTRLRANCVAWVTKEVSKMTLKQRNYLQIHILHLLEEEPSVELFTALAEAWKIEDLKTLVHQAYLIAHLTNKGR